MKTFTGGFYLECKWTGVLEITYPPHLRPRLLSTNYWLLTKAVDMLKLHAWENAQRVRLKEFSIYPNNVTKTILGTWKFPLHPRRVKLMAISGAAGFKFCSSLSVYIHRVVEVYRSCLVKLYHFDWVSMASIWTTCCHSSHLSSYSLVNKAIYKLGLLLSCLHALRTNTLHNVFRFCLTLRCNRILDYSWYMNIQWCW